MDALNYLCTFILSYITACVLQEKKTRKEIDLVGMLIICFMVSCGGGTIRDVLLDKPVFWIMNPLYIWYFAGGLISCQLFYHYVPLDKWKALYRALDSLCLAVFTTTGVLVAQSYLKSNSLWNENLINNIWVFGVITGVGGGIIRDVLLKQKPIILYRDVFFMSSFLGGVLLEILINYKFSEINIFIITVLTVFCFRETGFRIRNYYEKGRPTV